MSARSFIFWNASVHPWNPSYNCRGSTENHEKPLRNYGNTEIMTNTHTIFHPRNIYCWHDCGCGGGGGDGFRSIWPFVVGDSVCTSLTKKWYSLREGLGEGVPGHRKPITRTFTDRRIPRIPETPAVTFLFDGN